MMIVNCKLILVLKLNFKISNAIYFSLMTNLYPIKKNEIFNYLIIFIFKNVSKIFILYFYLYYALRFIYLFISALKDGYGKCKYDANIRNYADEIGATGDYGEEIGECGRGGRLEPDEEAELRETAWRFARSQQQAPYTQVQERPAEVRSR